MALPDAEKERGIMAFAKAPPKIDGSIVRDLREWTKAPPAPDVHSSEADDDMQMMAIERMVRKRKGSWWQLPKDLPDEPEGT